MVMLELISGETCMTSSSQFLDDQILGLEKTGTKVMKD
jgi:hypothetical protein